MFELLADHRRRLCDQLDTIEPGQWDRPSLCAGWRVRDVLGHLVSVMDVPTWRFVVGTVGLNGFHRRADRFAREFGQREPAALVARYRELATSRRTPPFIGPIAPLADVVVHGLDLGRPLDLTPVHTDEVARLVLGRLSRGLPAFGPGRLVNGLRFEATDLDWAVGPGGEGRGDGEGQLVRGPAADLLLALTGRSAGAPALTGPGAEILRTRLREAR